MIKAWVAGAQYWSGAFLSFATRGHRQASLVLAIAALLCCLPGYFVIPPTDRDEGRFIQASKQMLESGDFIDIRYQEEARHKKPIGIYWLQTAAVKLSGLGTAAPLWVYRLPSLIGAVAAVLLTYWALFPLIGRLEAVIAGLLMAGAIGLGIEARIAKTDAVLLATVVAAMGALIRAVLDPDAARKGAASTVFWSAIGIGLLIKGPITPLVVGLSALFIGLHRRSADFFKALRPWRGLAIVLAIALPWFVAITIQSDWAFFRGSLGEDMFAKIGGAAEMHWGPPGYYTALMWIFAWPGAPFLLISLPWLWQHRKDQRVVILAAWLLPTWVLFEIISTKLPHYVLPTYPALMGLIALALCQAGDGLVKRWRSVILMGLWLFPLLIGVGAAITVFVVEEKLVLSAVFTAIVATGLGMTAIALVTRKPPLAVPLMTLSAGFLIFSVMQISAPALRSIWLSQSLAEVVKTATYCPEPRLAIGGYHEPSFVFLTRTDTLLTDGRGAADFIAQGGCRLAIVDAIPPKPDEISNDVQFQKRLAEHQLKGEVLAEVRGRNVNGFKARRMVIWRLLPARAT